MKKDYRLGSGTSRVMGQFFFLYIFENNALIDESFIKLDIIQQIFRYNLMKTEIQIEYWKSEEDGGGTGYRDKKLTMPELLKESPEMRAFVKEFYPEYAL